MGANFDKHVSSNGVRKDHALAAVCAVQTKSPAVCLSHSRFQSSCAPREHWSSRRYMLALMRSQIYLRRLQLLQAFNHGQKTTHTSPVTGRRVRCPLSHSSFTPMEQGNVFSINLKTTWRSVTRTKPFFSSKRNLNTYK